nr:hypothetical protein [Tanacetum cinerariifolium]
MAEIKVLPITLLLLFCLVTSESGSMARKMHEIKPEKDLVSRINGEKDNGGLMDCWNALLELKSCTNEIILFLLNGDSYLTIDCCRAIRMITYGCWPSMLTSLGFTSEEGDILRGYCGATPLPQPVMFEGPVLPVPLTVGLWTLPSISGSDQQKAKTNETTYVYKEGHEMEEARENQSAPN